MESTEAGLAPLTTRQLAASFFGWLATGFGTWLMIPAYIGVYKAKGVKIKFNIAFYFAAWLSGDVLHLTALILEKVGPHQWVLYVIIAAAESLTLVTMLFNAHAFFWQAPLPSTPDEDDLGSVGIAIAGWTFGPATPKPGTRVCGIASVTFWMAFGTFFSFSVAIILWLCLAVKQFGGLAPPNPSSWPHDVPSKIAFVFGWIGFICWVAPRVVNLVRKKDEISGSSVVFGLGAHLFNATNIGILNFQTASSAAAALPFFLTSACCIVLDLVRLWRKKQMDKYPIHGRADPHFFEKDARLWSKKRAKKEKKQDGRRKNARGSRRLGHSPPSPSSESESHDSSLPLPGVNPYMLAPAFGWDTSQGGLESLSESEREVVRRHRRGKERDKMEEVIRRLKPRKEGDGTAEQRERVTEEVNKLEKRETTLKAELRKLAGKESLQPFEWERGWTSSAEEEWKVICERENWSTFDGNPLPCKNATPEDLKDGKKRSNPFNSFDYGATQTLRLAKHVLGGSDPTYKKLMEKIRQANVTFADLKGVILEHRSQSQGPFVHSPDSASHRPISRVSTHSSLSLGHHRRRTSVSESSSFDSDHNFDSEFDDSLSEEDSLYERGLLRDRGATGRRSTSQR